MPGDNDVDKLLSELFGEDIASNNLDQYDVEGAAFTLCEIVYTPKNRSASSLNASEIRQTLFVFRAPEFGIPQFHFHPRHTGLLHGLFSGGSDSIEFENSPKFSSLFTLQAWKEAAVRVIFGKPLREFLEEDGMWSGEGVGEYVVLYRYDEVVPADRLDEVTNQSIRILGMIQHGLRDLDRLPAIPRNTSSHDIVQAAGKAQGFLTAGIATWIRKVAVSAEDMQRFISSDTPRPIPEGMNRQVLRGNILLTAIGMCVTVLGGGAATTTLVLFDGSERWVGLALLIASIVGLVITCLSVRSRKSRKRSLQYGVLKNGRIISVRHTGIIMDNQRRFVAELQFDSDGVTTSSTMNIYGAIVAVARYLRFANRDVQIIVDDSNPRDVVCLELLLVSSSSNE